MGALLNVDGIFLCWNLTDRRMALTLVTLLCRSYSAWLKLENIYLEYLPPQKKSYKNLNEQILFKHTFSSYFLKHLFLDHWGRTEFEGVDSVAVVSTFSRIKYHSKPRI
jgi:hypothetical protein